MWELGATTLFPLLIPPPFPRSLVAQDLGIPSWYRTNWFGIGTGNCLTLIVDLGTGFAVNYFFQAKPLPNAHFPYGFNVAPDVH